MCIIIVKNNKKVLSNNIILKSVSLNPHGFGITYLDTAEVYKTMDMVEAASILKSNRPFIAHCRLTTVGETNLANAHPYKIGDEAHLYHNGTVSIETEEGESDSSAVARLLSEIGPFTPMAKKVLELTDSRFVISDGKQYTLANKAAWISRKYAKFSKVNVLSNQLIFVYGTLKEGHGNHMVLGKAKPAGKGHTVNKHKLCVSGLPYLIPGKGEGHNGKGEGHNVKGELYVVNKEQFANVDALEGHPNFYKRQHTKIYSEEMKMEVTAWVYFVGESYDSGVYVDEYEKPTYTSRHYPEKKKENESTVQLFFREFYGLSIEDATDEECFKAVAEYLNSTVEEMKSDYNQYIDLYLSEAE